MTVADLDTLGDAAYRMLHAAEEAKRDLLSYGGAVHEAHAGQLLREFLRTVMPVIGLAELERLAVAAALERGKTITGAARLLGLPKTTLHDRLTRLRLLDTAEGE